MKSFIFVILGIVLLLVWFWSINSRMKKADEKLSIFIDECISKGGSIQEVGSVFTQHKLICNPKIINLE